LPNNFQWSGIVRFSHRICGDYHSVLNGSPIHRRRFQRSEFCLSAPLLSIELSQKWHVFVSFVPSLPGQKVQCKGNVGNTQLWRNWVWRSPRRPSESSPELEDGLCSCLLFTISDLVDLISSLFAALKMVGLCTSIAALVSCV
jgi:hypothetical protein